MDIIFLTIGLILGFIPTYLFFKFKTDKNPEHDRAIVEFNQEIEKIRSDLQVELERSKAVSAQLTESKEELQNERASVIKLNTLLAESKADYKNLKDKLDNQKQEVDALQKQFTDRFNNLANKIFEEKTQKFTQQNKDNLDTILKPLSEKLKDFEKKVDDTYIKNVKDRTDLQAEIKKLYDLNSKISEDANNLTKALKGDVKKQGNWGEFVLERILEGSGLENGREYKTQVSLSNKAGKRYQPDVVIYLPDNKHIVIDSKVSLVAYEKLVNAETQEEQDKFLKQHIDSIKSHIKELADKQYYSLEGLNSPEYVLMFVPIESSFSIAVKQDTNIFNHAWDSKIVIVSPSTLTATLLTVASIWRQENQTRNIMEIAKKSGDLYDKFVGLLNDLVDVGKKLRLTQDAYEASMNKLSEGKGNLVKRVEDLKVLGVKTSKKISQQLLERAKS